MDIAAELDTLRNQAKKRIVEAVNDTGRLSALVKLLEDVDKDASILGQLERNVGEYHNCLTTPLNGLRLVTQAAPRSTTNRKQLGSSVRRAFAQAHDLIQVKGVVYANAAGSTFGLTMASEDKRGDKWFLGLPDQQYKAIILLCLDGNTQLDFVIPAQSLTIVWSQLSRSGDEVKFNIKRKNLEYTLMVPTHGPFGITQFLGNYWPLAN